MPTEYFGPKNKKGKVKLVYSRLNSANHSMSPTAVFSVSFSILYVSRCLQFAEATRVISSIQNRPIADSQPTLAVWPPLKVDDLLFDIVLLTVLDSTLNRTRLFHSEEAGKLSSARRSLHASCIRLTCTTCPYFDSLRTLR